MRLMTVSVHLVRHGEVFNPDKVLYGRLPGFGLSALGHQMAEEFADGWKTAPQILVASPLQRAQETIEPLAQKFKLEVRTDERVVEAENSVQGLSDVRRELRKPRSWAMLMNPLRSSWDEPYAQQVARVTETMKAIRD